MENKKTLSELYVYIYLHYLAKQSQYTDWSNVLTNIQKEYLTGVGIIIGEFLLSQIQIKAFYITYNNEDVLMSLILRSSGIDHTHACTQHLLRRSSSYKSWSSIFKIYFILSLKKIW